MDRPSQTDKLEISMREVSFDEPAVQGLLAEWNDELGFTPKGGSTVQVKDFAFPRGVFLLAVSGGEPVGCAGLRRLTSTTGEVKRVFVRKAARGRGVGRALLTALERLASEQGFSALRLDTDGGDPGVVALFRSAGFEPISDYNGNPYARYWFVKRRARVEDS